MTRPAAPPFASRFARLRPRSLAARMTIAAAGWSVVALVVSAVVLTTLYRASVERGFDARLGVYQKALAGALAAAQGGEVPDDGAMGEPQFLLPLSGWYWLVRDAGSGEVVAMSRSLFGDVLDLGPAAESVAPRAFYLAGPAGEELRVQGQIVVLDGGRRLEIVVAGNADELKTEVASFARSVFVTLAVFAAGLVLATVVQIRIGLRPLRHMRAALGRIRDGTADRLAGDFPTELAPLAAELNALIEANARVVERARANTGNLAHALKTPLSVIINETRADGGTLAAKVLEQADLMRGRIEVDLDRARIAAERKVVGASSDLRPSLDGLARVLRRAYADRELLITVDCPADLKIRMERRDVEEVFGNLLDNACKYGRGRVDVTARRVDTVGGRGMAEIRIDDDGPGLSQKDRGLVVRRGFRLDESVPGSGLGLAIVDELVEAYGGTHDFGDSPLGGLAVLVRLPAS